MNMSKKVYARIEAKAALAAIQEDLKTHAEVFEICDPAEIAESAAAIMADVKHGLKNLLTYLGSRDCFGDDDGSLKNLLLGGDPIVVDFVTDQGPGRLTLSPVNLDEPVVLDKAPDRVRHSWQKLYA